MIRNMVLAFFCFSGMVIFSQAPQQKQARFDHSIQPYLVALSVADLDRTVAWYQQNLGFEVKKKADFPEHKVRIAMMAGGDFWLELIERQGAKPWKDHLPSLKDSMDIHGLKKMAFAAKDVTGLFEAFKAQGVTISNPPWTDDFLGFRVKTFICKDPDGNSIQFFQKLDDPDR